MPQCLSPCTAEAKQVSDWFGKVWVAVRRVVSSWLQALPADGEEGTQI